MNRSPELSVVMSVFNGQKHLEESISSILEQTYSDFEFIIINDGSTDGTKEIIDRAGAGDDRIVAVHQDNRGLATSLNRGIKQANGRYIARQDADDVSLPHRFERQMAFLTSNPDVVLCGTCFLEVNEEKGAKVRRYPVEDVELRKTLKYVNYFCHPSVIFSKQTFLRAGRYDETFVTSQDFELWIRMANIGKIANLPDVLVKRRIGFDGAISWQKRREKVKAVQFVLTTHFDSFQEIDILKFTRYCVPKLLYGYIPVPVLKAVRKIRYGKNPDNL